MNMEAEQPKTTTFESKFKRLNEIVSALEREQSDLDQAVRMYKEGVKLTAECRDLLKQAKLEITKLEAVTDEDDQ